MVRTIFQWVIVRRSIANKPFLSLPDYPAQPVVLSYQAGMDTPTKTGTVSGKSLNLRILSLLLRFK
jgi:hypothetical protein